MAPRPLQDVLLLYKVTNKTDAVHKQQEPAYRWVSHRTCRSCPGSLEITKKGGRDLFLCGPHAEKKKNSGSEHACFVSRLLVVPDPWGLGPILIAEDFIKLYLLYISFILHFVICFHFSCFHISIAAIPDTCTYTHPSSTEDVFVYLTQRLHH